MVGREKGLSDAVEEFVVESQGLLWSRLRQAWSSFKTGKAQVKLS